MKCRDPYTGHLVDVRPQDIKRTAILTIEGELVQFLYRNPHSFVHVMAPDDKGEMQRWSIEWGGGGQLARQGVGRETLKVGDKVVVVGDLGRNPADHRLRMRSIVRPSDGWKWGGEFN